MDTSFRRSLFRWIFRWKQGDEDENWSKKAIDSLTKKLQKHNKEALALLETALSTEGRDAESCVTIPRSLDGRLQISHRKALPHVIYCRLFRWPDLTSHHELKAMPRCCFSFDSGQKDVCINPYHYERVNTASLLPPVLVPKFSDLPPQQKNVFSEKIPCVSGKQWATISYYELNNRVGEQVKVSSTECVINGFTDPTNSTSKISLGLFSNVNRNAAIENTRRQIGKGVKLTWVPHQGTLYAETLESAVFIQSRNFNWINNFNPATVCKLTAGHSLKIFDSARFVELLNKCLEEGSFTDSYELTKMTIIRLSFVKGWGRDYQRQDIASTPCWLEIHLHAPLIWLDEALQRLNSLNKDDLQTIGSNS